MRRNWQMSVGMFAWLAAAMCGAAHAEQVNLTVGNGSGYPGGTAACTVTMNATAAPATVSFRIAFDSTKLTVTNVQDGPVVTAAGKELEWDVPTPGTLAVAIFGVNQTTISNGTLATVTFSIQGSVATPSNLPLDGNTQSSSDASGQALTTSIADGSLNVTACTTPSAPAGVSATDGTYANRVRITWDASSGATSYMVYRATSGNSNSAALMATVVGTIYDDFSAAPATPGGSGGCGGSSTPQVTTYFYWVRAVNACSQSVLSASDSGYRGQAKAASGEPAAEAALPAKAAGPVMLDASLALRLRSVEPIDPGSVWGLVETDSMQDSAVRWVPAGDSDSDGWVVYTPEIAWAPGELIWMSAGATTVSGEPLSTVTYAFKATPDGAISEAGAKGIPASATLTPVDTAGLPELIEAAGPAYAIAPQTVFDTPETISLPIPSGINPEDVEVYYLASTPGGPVWHRGQSMDGWLLDTAVEADALTIAVRHGGIVCLGYRADLANVMAASVVGGGSALDNVMLMSLMVLTLAIAHWRQSRRGSAA